MLTPKQEAYCLARTRGLSQRQAYREAYPHTSSWGKNSVDVAASRLESDAKVALRLRELREAAAREAKITRAQVIDRLADLAEDAFERAQDATPLTYAAASGAAIRSHEALLKWLPEDEPEGRPAFVADFGLLVAPSFLEPHRLIARGEITDVWLAGGRGSMKSSFAALELVNWIERNPDQHGLVLMRYKNSLRDSAYAQVVWAIDMLGLSDEYDLPESTLRIRKKSTGQLILFRGCDNPKKIKSIKVPFGHIGVGWFEEADMFRGMAEIRMINQSLTRGGSEFVRIYSFNPPRSKMCWVNEHCAEMESRGERVFRSTYLEAPREWLGEQFIADAEHLRDTDPQAYEHEYLGIPVGLGGNVFDNVVFREVTGEEISAFDNIRCGQDFGWWPDPWAFTMGEWRQASRTLISFAEEGGNKLQPDEQAQKIAAMLTWADEAGDEPEYHYLTVRSDDANPTAIAAQKAAGVKAVAAQKGNMRMASYEFMASIEWIIDPSRCPRLAKEVRQMEYEQNADGEWLNSIPDGNDHWVDAARYSLMDIARRGKRAYATPGE